jgi:hypothetical protein
LDIERLRSLIRMGFSLRDPMGVGVAMGFVIGQLGSGINEAAVRQSENA